MRWKRNPAPRRLAATHRVRSAPRLPSPGKSAVCFGFQPTSSRFSSLITGFPHRDPHLRGVGCLTSRCLPKCARARSRRPGGMGNWGSSGASRTSLPPPAGSFGCCSATDSDPLGRIYSAATGCPGFHRANKGARTRGSLLPALGCLLLAPQNSSTPLTSAWGESGLGVSAEWAEPLREGWRGAVHSQSCDTPGNKLHLSGL